MSGAPYTASPSTRWDLGNIVYCLHEIRDHWRQTQHRREVDLREFPSREVLAEITGGLRGALFPMRLGPQDLRREAEDHYVGYTLAYTLDRLEQQVALELALQQEALQNVEAQAHAIVQSFAHSLPGIRALLDTDVAAAFHGDPAARSVDEVLLCYPGILAMINHRLAHCLHGLGLPLVARIIAELAHAETGIDIHPGAQIGGRFFIDHGTGVVIGETAVIGQRVRLYQAVTLGAKRFNVTEDGSLEKGAARHPVVEDDVIIYAGATILGRVVIGRGSVIGGNVWLTHSLPASSHITQADVAHAPQEPEHRT